MIQEWILLAWYKIIEKKKKEDKKSYEETRNEGRSEKKKREWRIVQEKAEIEKLEWIFLDVIRSDVVNYWIFFLTNLVTRLINVFLEGQDLFPLVHVYCSFRIYCLSKQLVLLHSIHSDSSFFLNGWAMCSSSKLQAIKRL